MIIERFHPKRVMLQTLLVACRTSTSIVNVSKGVFFRLQALTLFVSRSASHT